MFGIISSFSFVFQQVLSLCEENLQEIPKKFPLFLQHLDALCPQVLQE